MSANGDLDKQRRKLVAADQALAATLTRRYSLTWQRIRRQLDRLVSQMEAARKRGETIDQAWLARHRSIEYLDRAATAELRVYIEFAERNIDRAALDQYLAGRTDALTLLRSSLPPGFPLTPVSPALPVAQLDQIRQATRAGTPLRQLLEQLGADQAQRAVETLTEGVAVGRGPREIARHLRDSFAGNQVRALRVARTETIRAYRTATHERFREHRNVVKGWVWVAQFDERTCSACLAMHGTEHEPDEMLGSHPSCRCTAAPLTRTWAELGFPDVPETGVEVASSEEWFARQPETVQRRVLGPGRLAEYQAGRLRLAEMAVPTQNPVWGPGIRERTLRETLIAV